MLVWDPQEGYDHVLNGVRHHFDSILQRKRKNCYAVTALRRLFTLHVRTMRSEQLGWKGS